MLNLPRQSVLRRGTCGRLPRPELPAARQAFTLVELLVVITIIGILVGLLMPAVQSARESAKRATCSNNLHQLSLGCLNHNTQYGFLPSDGFDSTWIGDPNQPAGSKQPGGWVFSILPFIDQKNLYELQLGNTNTTAAATLIATVVPSCYCPTRRGVALYPTSQTAGGFSGAGLSGGTMPAGVAKTDYGANGGDVYTTNPSVATGVIFARSQVGMGLITDGTSSTYLLGEKSICPDNYFNGTDTADSNNAYVGDCQDLCRWANNPNIVGTTIPPPAQDSPGNPYQYTFGSAHPTGFGVAMCDGSVRVISYSIDPTTHQRLANRSDGYAVDASKF